MHNALACSITVRVKPKNKHLSTEGILRTSVVTTTRGGNSRNKKPINAEDIAQSIGLSSLSTSQVSVHGSAKAKLMVDNKIIVIVKRSHKG